jgi:hypothetical protein
LPISIADSHRFTSFRNLTSLQATLAGIQVGDAFEEGRTIKATMTLSAMSDGLAVYVNETPYELTADRSAQDFYAFSFVIPSKDIQIALVFLAPENAAGGIFTVLSDEHTYVLGIESGKRYVTPTFTILHDTGYEVFAAGFYSDTHSTASLSVEHVTFAFADGFASSDYAGASIDITVTPEAGYVVSSVSEKDAKTEVTLVSGNTYRLVMPDSDITLTAAATEEKASITMDLSYLEDFHNYVLNYTNETHADTGTYQGDSNNRSCTYAPLSCYVHDVIHFTLYFQMSDTNIPYFVVTGCTATALTVTSPYNYAFDVTVDTVNPTMTGHYSG